MHPPAFNTRLASPRNLAWSNQWAADDAASKSTEPSGNGSSSAEPFLVGMAKKVRRHFGKFSLTFYFTDSLELQLLHGGERRDGGRWLKLAPSERLINSLSQSQTRFSHQPVLMLLLQEERQEVATQTGDCHAGGWVVGAAGCSQCLGSFPSVEPSGKEMLHKELAELLGPTPPVTYQSPTSHLLVAAEIRSAGRPVRKDSVVILQAVWWLAASPITIITTITITCCGSRLSAPSQTQNHASCWCLFLPPYHVFCSHILTGANVILPCFWLFSS